MTRRKALREKDSRRARRGVTYPTTGAARPAQCVQCGFEYDEAKGWPEDGIEPGTRWDDIPEDWSCPDCGAAKSDFEMVEIARS